MDPVIIRPPGVDYRAFVVSLETVWYARVLLLFSASAMTDTGSKSFDCALDSTLETFDDPHNGNYSIYRYFIHIIAIVCIMAIMHITAIISFISDCFLVGWLASVGSHVVYELDYKKPILFVIPIQRILVKLPLVPVGDTDTIPHSMRNAFSGAPGDRRSGAGDGCQMWFVNSWALRWSRDL
jgi:hypothetical protein